jgi:hypothetical protein
MPALYKAMTDNLNCRLHVSQQVALRCKLDCYGSSIYAGIKAPFSGLSNWRIRVGEGVLSLATASSTVMCQVSFESPAKFCWSFHVKMVRSHLLKVARQHNTSPLQPPRQPVMPPRLAQFICPSPPCPVSSYMTMIYMMIIYDHHI